MDLKITLEYTDKADAIMIARLLVRVLPNRYLREEIHDEDGKLTIIYRKEIENGKQTK